MKTNGREVKVVVEAGRSKENERGEGGGGGEREGDEGKDEVGAGAGKGREGEHFARGWVRLNRERVEHSWRVLCACCRTSC